MILISHRGNLNGNNPERENSVDYINDALQYGFDVEIDIWLIDNDWFLGHDKPQYKTTYEFFNNRMWLHCKNYHALERLIFSELNFFYHTTEDYVLTSKKYIWAFPGKIGGQRAISVFPERTNLVDGYCGICSDCIERFL